MYGPATAGGRNVESFRRRLPREVAPRTRQASHDRRLPRTLLFDGQESPIGGCSPDC